MLACTMITVDSINEWTIQAVHKMVRFDLWKKLQERVVLKEFR